MKFSPGDKVQLLDELTKGEVLEVLQGMLRILTEDGFELEVPVAEVVLLPGDEAMHLDVGVPAISDKEERLKRKAPGKRKSKDRSAPPMKVDLHIEKLLSTTRGMTSFDMLDFQLETARRQLEFAIRKRLQRVVFIHGVGEGVLKEELRTLFRRYEGLKYRDADYRTYGLGATEVYIPQEVHH